MLIEDDEAKEKLQFARLHLTEPDPFKAALQLHPENTNRALLIASKWPKDPEFVRMMATLRNEALEEKGVTADEDFVESELKKIIRTEWDTELKLKALDSFMELKGLSKKPAAQTNVAVMIPKAIEIPHFESQDEWEVVSVQSQNDLLNVSRSRH